MKTNQACTSGSNKLSFSVHTRMVAKKLLLILPCITGLAFAADNTDMSNMDMSSMKGMSSGTHAKMKAQNTKKPASGTSMKM